MLLSSVVLCMCTALAGTPLPQWTAPQPDGTKPLAGFAAIPNVTTVQVLHGDETVGGKNRDAKKSSLSQPLRRLVVRCPQDDRATN